MCRDPLARSSKLTLQGDVTIDHPALHSIGSFVEARSTKGPALRFAKVRSSMLCTTRDPTPLGMQRRTPHHRLSLSSLV